jgi:hypothetical protein
VIILMLLSVKMRLKEGAMNLEWRKEFVENVYLSAPGHKNI